MNPWMSSHHAWGGESDYLLTPGKFTAPCYLMSSYFSASWLFSSSWLQKLLSPRCLWTSPKGVLLIMKDAEIQCHSQSNKGLSSGSEVKNSLANAEDPPGWTPVLGRSPIPWRRGWQPTQYSCLENLMDRGAWRTTVHGDAKSWIGLSYWTRVKSIGNDISLFLHWFFNIFSKEVSFEISLMHKFYSSKKNIQGDYL